MKDPKVKLSVILPFIALIAVAGALLFQNILPYKLSGQDPISLTGLMGDYDHADQEGTFHGQKIFSNPKDTHTLASSNILGTSDPGVEKRIEVDLTNQKLYAVENDEKIAEFDVSTGKWGRTPTGTFKIWIKLVRTKMSGGSKALGTYYYLPNVPYTMFFYNEETPKHVGYGIHGAYWHSNFGIPMSHGCINMRTRDVEKLFYWANPEASGNNITYPTDEDPGTEVVIYGEAPTS